MYIDSNLYINFHRYIDVISCNKHYFKIEDLKNVKELKSIYSITEPTIDIHDYIDRIIKIVYTKDIYIDGIIINAAAYTHTSVGIGDAIKAIDTKVIEVHISNTFSREEYRHNSYLSPVVDGIIIGFGLKSYELAIESFLSTDE